MRDLLSELEAIIRTHVDDSLRSLSYYEGRDYEIQFLRDDMGRRYSEEEIEEVFDELVLSGLSRDYFEKLFHAGRIECQIFGFEEAAMFHFIVNDIEGVFLSFDRDVEINLDSFIDDCKGVIERF